MANRLSKEKARAIAAEYLTNGYNKVDALKTVGYSKNYSEHFGLKLFDNNTVKAEITRMQAKAEHKIEGKIKNRAERQVFWSDVCDSDKVAMADRLRASELLGRSEADFTDNINSTDIVRKAELDAEQKAEAQRIINIRLREMGQNNQVG